MLTSPRESVALKLISANTPNCERDMKSLEYWLSYTVLYFVQRIAQGHGVAPRVGDAWAQRRFT